MMVWYDDEGDSLHVWFEWVEGRTHSERVEERHFVRYDEHGNVTGVDVLFVSRGLRLDLLPQPDRILELIRRFRSATANIPELAITS